MARLKFSVDYTQAGGGNKTSVANCTEVTIMAGLDKYHIERHHIGGITVRLVSDHMIPLIITPESGNVVRVGPKESTGEMDIEKAAVQKFVEWKKQILHPRNRKKPLDDKEKMILLAMLERDRIDERTRAKLQREHDRATKASNIVASMKAPKKTKKKAPRKPKG